jgi:hypothetical protein
LPPSLICCFYWRIDQEREMPSYCKYCSKSTDGDLAHPECIRLHNEGWTDAQITAMLEGRSNPAGSSVSQPGVQYLYVYPRPVTFGTIMGATVVGNLIFGMIAGFIYFITH